MHIFKTFFVLFITLFISSCSNDEILEDVKVAVPIYKSKTTIRANVQVTSAVATNSEGKIYVAEKLLFYIAQENGVHIFDNANPSNPQNLAYLQIEGVHDISVKGNYLYADNFMDLLVFDISNLQQISLVQTLTDVFEFYPTYPMDADYMAWDVQPNEGDVLIGFKIENRKRPNGQLAILAGNAMANFESQIGGDVGTGGSMARFQINNQALYVVEKYRLSVFNIVQPTQVFYHSSIYLHDWIGTGELETLFLRSPYLFIGATTGMFVINAENPFQPFYVSGFSHATACDPVVVENQTAYITVRGGSTCGAIQDQINVIDVSQINQPTLLSTYLLSQPYGLGVKNQTLYVCANQQLHVFNAQNPQQLQLLHSYPVNVTDVIPLPNQLIAVGNNLVIQYTYGPNHTLIPLSTLTL
jgi:hypothetical protein